MQADCQGECVVEIARNIGTDYVVSGEMTKLGDMFVLNIKLHETARGQLLAVEDARGSKLDEMLDHAKLGGALVVRKGLGLSGGSATSSSSSFVGGQFGSSGSANSDWLSDSGADVSVHFESVPSGAAVYIDGQFLCSTTPCQKYVKEGSHEVRFNLQRYSDKIERVVVKKGSVIKERWRHCLVMQR